MKASFDQINKIYYLLRNNGWIGFDYFFVKLNDLLSKDVVGVRTIQLNSFAILCVTKNDIYVRCQTNEFDYMNSAAAAMTVYLIEVFKIRK